MRKGTKIGWILVALSIVLSVWVIAGHSSQANQTTDDGYELSDDGTELISYSGSGGSISIPSGVTTIDAGVFADNTSITAVTLPSTVTSLGEGVFAGCSSLQSISLGSVTSIPSETFYDCASLSSISIPSSVSSIGYRAFYGTGLSSITIPSSVTSIDGDAFEDSKNLTSIGVDSGNGTYSSSDGCLYNASGTRLLIVPEGKSSVTISSGCTTIGSGAFSRCTNLSSLTIPSNVTTMETDAFSGSAIDTITIPASVTSIGSQSNWAPSVIYGYEGSAAEDYASANSIPFIVIGTSDSSDTSDTTDTNHSSSTDTSTADKPGSAQNASDTSGSAAAAGGAAGAASTSGGAGGSTSGGKDSTPTTADGDIDPRFILCLAIFAGGLTLILSERRKQALISALHKNEDDVISD